MKISHISHIVLKSSAKSSNSKGILYICHQQKGFIHNSTCQHEVFATTVWCLMILSQLKSIYPVLQHTEHKCNMLY